MSEKEKGTVIYRPTPPAAAKPQGMRTVGCLAVFVLAGIAYVCGVAYFAHEERRQADIQVRKVDSFALASFGVEKSVAGWPETSEGLPQTWGMRDRALLEERLKSLKGKKVTASVPPPEAWERVKADPRESRLPIPATARVVDFADAPSSILLESFHGTSHFLWVLVTYGIEGAERPAAVARFEAVVFSKGNRVPVWIRVFEETEIPAQAEGVSRDPAALEKALEIASRRAIERLASALESDSP